MNTGRIITALAAILAIPAMAADAPGYFKLPGTETSMQVYGKAETFAFYRINTSNGSAGMDVSTPEDQSHNEKGLVDSNVVGRIGITSTTPSAYGDVIVKVEFQGGGTDGNSDSLNMRHAYGEFAGLLIGQTDSLFKAWHNGPSANDTMGGSDFGGHSRTRQARYTFTPTKEVKLGISLEQDQSDRGNTITGYAEATKLGPALVVAGQYSADWGNVAASIGYQKARTADIDDTTGDKTTTSGNGTSFAVSAAWNITANDSITARVINGGGQFGAGGDGFYQDGTKYKFYKSTSYDLGYTHVWNDQFTSNLGLGQVNYPKKDEASAIKWTVTSFFVNTNWKVAKNVTFGAEYFYSQTKSKLKDTVSAVEVGQTKNKFKNQNVNLMFSYTFF